jgi:hypothetical protein
MHIPVQDRTPTHAHPPGRHTPQTRQRGAKFPEGVSSSKWGPLQVRTILSQRDKVESGRDTESHSRLEAVTAQVKRPGNVMITRGRTRGHPQTHPRAEVDQQ